jgi:hypothetical protein
MSQDGILPRSRETMKPPETIEEELAIIAEAIEAGIDPFPPEKEPSKWAKLALGWFMIIIMVTWVSDILYRSL